jgi:hypothetical protein
VCRFSDWRIRFRNNQLFLYAVSNQLTLHMYQTNLFCLFVCLFLARQPRSGPGPPHSRGFYITHNDASQSVRLLWTSDQLVASTSTRPHTALTPEYLQASSVGFEPTISAGERPQTHAVDSAANGTGNLFCTFYQTKLLCTFYRKARTECVVLCYRDTTQTQLTVCAPMRRTCSTSFLISVWPSCMEFRSKSRKQ